MDNQRKLDCKNRLKSGQCRGNFEQGRIRMIRFPRLDTAMVMLAVLLAVFVFGKASGAEQREVYPAKPIALVCPLAPGGGNDTLARFIAKHLSESLGQQVIVVNRPGAGGNLGAEFVARSKPDGYTLLLGGSGQLVAPRSARIKFDPQRDFAPITMVGEFPSVLVVQPSLPVKTVRDLIDLAKSRPGQINYGSSGYGSSGHLVMEQFKHMAGIDMAHIPYKGASQAMTNLLAGEVSLVFSSPAGALSFVREGQVRALAISGSKRIAALPDIPTLDESGLTGFNTTVWLSVVAPAATPKNIITRLNSEIVKIVERKTTQEWLAKNGLEPIGNTPEEFAAKLKSDIENLEKLVRETGIVLE